MSTVVINPDLDRLLSALRAPIPSFVCFRGRDGRLHPLKKDCECIAHEGPHWLEADRSWREANRRIITDHPESASAITLHQFGVEERACLRQKATAMEAAGVEILLDEDAALALQSAGEPVFRLRR
jgi:hypothetical protein